MGLSINTNIASLAAQRRMNRNASELQVSMARLSSGTRINSAKDDAAGLATSTRLNTQTNGMKVAIRNANDAVSFTQTTESALDEVTTSLQRIRDLAIQSSNDSNSAKDRQSLQAEVHQLISEINRIAQNTTFNGKKVADGSVTASHFQIGANAGETLTIGGVDARASALGKQPGETRSTWLSVGTSKTTGSINSLSSFSIQVEGGKAVNITSASNGGSVDPVSISALKSTTDAAYGRGMAKDLSARINDLRSHGTEGLENVYATAKTSMSGSDVATSSSTPGTIDLGAMGKLINPVYVDGKWYAHWDKNGNGVANVSGVMDVGDLMSHQYLDTIFNKDITLSSTSPTGSSTDQYRFAEINGYKLGLAVAGAGHTGVWSIQGTSIDSMQPGQINSTYDGLSAIWDAYNGNGVGTFAIAGTPPGWAAHGLALYWSSTSSAGSHYQVGLLTGQLQNVAADTSNGYAALEILNPPWISAGTGTPVQAGQLATGDININGVDIGPANVSDSDASGGLVDAINAKSSITGVVASIDSEGRATLTADDGRDIVLNTTSKGSQVLWGVSTAITDQRKTGDVTLSANRTLNSPAGAAAGNPPDISNAEASGSVESIDVSTRQGSQTAISAVDSALSQIDDYRAMLGATQNRLDSTTRNLSAVSESLSAATSRITDTDFAAETAELAKHQVLQQAGGALLVQANALPQQLIALLK